MIIQEDYAEGLVRTYSDKGLRIRQEETGIIYDEAIDVKPCKYTYTETEETKFIIGVTLAGEPLYNG